MSIQARSVESGSVSTRTAWTVYTILRLVFFAVPFSVLYFALGWSWWLSAIIATIIAFSLSIIFLSRQRETASESIHDWRQRTRTADDIVEDEAVDGAAARDTAGPPSPDADAEADADVRPSIDRPSVDRRSTDQPSTDQPSADDPR